jgi:hypothetical protein
MRFESIQWGSCIQLTTLPIHNLSGAQQPLCSMPSPYALEEITLAGDDLAGETAAAFVLA